MNSATAVDPFTVLGVARDAGDAEIRVRYLELVKQFPPERDPDKFRQVRAAFEAAKDPLSIARRLLEPPGDEVPPWSDVIEAQKRKPPRLTPAFLLSLGNRAADDSRPSAGASPNRTSRDSKSDNDPAPSRQAIDAP